MNSTFSHKIGLIFAAFAAFASAACGMSAAENARPVEPNTVVTREVPTVMSDQPDPSQPTSFYKVTVTPRAARSAHSAAAATFPLRRHCVDEKCDLARLDAKPVLSLR